MQLEAAEVPYVWFVLVPLSQFHLFLIYSLDKNLSFLSSQAFAWFDRVPLAHVEIEMYDISLFAYIPSCPGTEFIFINEILKINIKLWGCAFMEPDQRYSINMVNIKPQSFFTSGGTSVVFPEHISNDSLLILGTFCRLEAGNHQCGELTADLCGRTQSGLDPDFKSAFHKSFDIGNCLNPSESILFFCICLYILYTYMYPLMYIFAYVVHICGGSRQTSWVFLNHYLPCWVKFSQLNSELLDTVV